MPTRTILLRLAVGIVNAPVLSWVVNDLHTAKGIGVGVGLLQRSELLTLASREEVIVVVELPSRALAPAIGIVLAELIAWYS